VKRIVVTGATGDIGRALCAALRDRGDAVIALSRDEARARARLGDGIEVARWREPASSPPPLEAVAGADAVVHLLGAPVAQRWTEAARAAIRDSRVQSTRHLVSALHALSDEDRPATLVSQSAVGIYGAAGDRALDENAHPGDDFLAQVVRAWESEAQAAEPALRVVRTRTGVVLLPDGGALARMLPFFRLGIGGPVASGQQYVPWVHLDDVVGALSFCVDEPEATGAINVTSPHPVTNSEFSRVLGRVLHRPAVLPVPALALRLLYGEMAQIVTTGQRVIPRQLELLGFRFHQPELEPALRDVLERP
jgi:uncharacterized protein (TIGR01777 family)